MTDRLRKKNTGEAGNGGEFGTRSRTAADTELVVVDGISYPDPAPEMGMHFQGAFDGPDGRELRWSSGSGHYETTILADGTIIHMADGDLHRMGAPAVIRPDGTEDWFIRGTKVADPRAHPSRTQVINEGTALERHVTIGAKFDRMASNDEIANRIRIDIDMARRTGLIPEKAHITVEQRKIGDFPNFDVIIGNLDQDTIAHPDRFGEHSPWYTDAGQSVHDSVAGLVAQHNYYAAATDPRLTPQMRFLSHVSVQEKD